MEEHAGIDADQRPGTPPEAHWGLERSRKQIAAVGFGTAGGYRAAKTHPASAATRPGGSCARSACVVWDARKRCSSPRQILQACAPLISCGGSSTAAGAQLGAAANWPAIFLTGLGATAFVAGTGPIALQRLQSAGRPFDNRFAIPTTPGTVAGSRRNDRRQLEPANRAKYWPAAGMLTAFLSHAVRVRVEAPRWFATSTDGIYAV